MILKQKRSAVPKHRSGFGGGTHAIEVCPPRAIYILNQSNAGRKDQIKIV